MSEKMNSLRLPVSVDDVLGRRSVSPEAVVNAVYHRSYEIREPVEVRITPGELVVLSFPGPDRSIRMDELRAGRAVSRRYRNRRLGEFLKELDLTEGRSTGIPKILRNMATNGSPVPEFETDDDRLSYLVRLPVHPQAKVDTGQVTGQVEPWVKAVLRSCAVSPMKSREIQKLTKISHRETFQRNYLDYLLEKEWIERTIPDKLTSPSQRYRLTEKGRKVLENQ